MSKEKEQGSEMKDKEACGVIERDEKYEIYPTAIEDSTIEVAIASTEINIVCILKLIKTINTMEKHDSKQEFDGNKFVV